MRLSHGIYGLNLCINLFSSINLSVLPIIFGLCSSNQGKPRKIECLRLIIKLKDIRRANSSKTTRICPHSSIIFLEATCPPSMNIIEVGQIRFSKVILCVRENSRCMKQEFTLVSKREETCMMVLFDVLTWTMTEKTLLTCLDKMQPLLGIG